MMTMELENGARLQIATDYKEISHSDYIDFQHAKLRFTESVISEDADLDVETMIECLGSIIKTPDGEKADIGSIEFMVDGDSVEGSLPNIMEEVSVWRLYNWYETLMADYSPQEFDFSKDDYTYTYKGEEYVLTRDRGYRVVSKNQQRYDLEEGNNSSEGKSKFKRFTAIEVVEVNTIYTLLRRSEKAAKKSDASDSFVTDLKMLAILLRRPGEELPTMLADREDWILERAKHFQEVPNWVIKDVTFFLSNLSRHLKIAQNTGLSFMERRNLISSGQLDAILREAMMKHTGKLIKKHTGNT